jgi:hypothetical protein
VQRDKLAAFQRKIATTSVLDPACGSGNFLYVSLQLLLDLEKEAVTFATQLGFKLAPQVSVQQLRAIEINPYAFELAQVSVQTIGKRGKRAIGGCLLVLVQTCGLLSQGFPVSLRLRESPSIGFLFGFRQRCFVTAPW